MLRMGAEVQFRAYEQQQGQLFPGHLWDAPDPSDPVFFIGDAVGSLEVSGFEGAQHGDGRAGVPAADAAEAVVVRGNGRGLQRARASATGALGPVVPVPGRGAAAGLPDDQPVSDEACQGSPAPLPSSLGEGSMDEVKGFVGSS